MDGTAGRTGDGGANPPPPPPGRRLTRVNGHRFSMPTAYTPQGRLVTLLAHTRFHRVRHQQVKGTNSPLDPRLTNYWEERRERSLLRRLMADGNRLRRYLLRRQ